MEEKRKISAEIVADSVDSRGNRITTFILQYPRMIHSEVLTHRMFSRNAASSRAIPFEKMVKSVQEDPFIPIAFQKDHKGMQGSEYLENEDLLNAQLAWVDATDNAVLEAGILSDIGVTKQLCNRILEPFLWYTNLVTATEYDNFFELRCPQYKCVTSIFKSKKDLKKFTLDKRNGVEEDWFENVFSKNPLRFTESHAEIHIQALAEAMWDARNESTPKQLLVGEWHIPFGENIDHEKLFKSAYPIDHYSKEYDLSDLYLKIATARAARLSYMTFEGEIDYAKDIAMHDSLLANKHASCFEHCAQAMSDDEFFSFTQGEIPVREDEGTWYQELEDIGEEDKKHGWCRNFKGFIPYRHLVNL